MVEIVEGPFRATVHDAVATVIDVQVLYDRHLIRQVKLTLKHGRVVPVEAQQEFSGRSPSYFRAILRFADGNEVIYFFDNGFPVREGQTLVCRFVIFEGHARCTSIYAVEARWVLKFASPSDIRMPQFQYTGFSFTRLFDKGGAVFTAAATSLAITSFSFEPSKSGKMDGDRIGLFLVAWGLVFIAAYIVCRLLGAFVIRNSERRDYSAQFEQFRSRLAIAADSRNWSEYQ